MLVRPIIVFICAVYSTGVSQVSQISCASTTVLNHISIVNDKIVIGDLSGFTGYSIDGFQSFTIASQPADMSAINFLSRVSEDTLVMLSYGMATRLFRTGDCGNTWNTLLDTSYGIRRLVVLGGNEFMLFGTLYKSLRTVNGSGWVNGVNAMTSVSAAASYGGSFVVIAGVSGNANNEIAVSKDKGNNWSTKLVNGSPAVIRNISILNNDTIAVVAGEGSQGANFLSLSIDGGTSWQTKTIPIAVAWGVKLATGGLYVLGKDNGGFAQVIVSKDFGLSWYALNTTYPGFLYDMAFAEANTAYLSGDGGLLLKWEMNQGGLTGLETSDELQPSMFTIVPNPAMEEITLKGFRYEDVQYTIRTVEGRVLQEGHLRNNTSENKINIGSLQAGIYFISLKGEGYAAVGKVVKE